MQLLAKFHCSKCRRTESLVCTSIGERIMVTTLVKQLIAAAELQFGWHVTREGASDLCPRCLVADDISL